MDQRSRASRMRVIGGIVAAGCLVALAPASAQAADPGWNCGASALRAQLGNLKPIEPLVANQGGVRCATDVVGAADLGDSIPLGTGLDAVASRTNLNDTKLAPASQQVSGDVRAARVRLPSTNPLLEVQGLESDAKAVCDTNKMPVLTGSSRVAKLLIGGQEFPTDRITTELLKGVDGLTGALLSIKPKEEIREGSGVSQKLTHRALHVTLKLGATSILDAVVGETSVAAIDDPCHATKPPGDDDDDDGPGGPGDETPGTPTPGHPFGGGRVVGLDQLRPEAKKSPCRRWKFGRQIAIVGTSKGDRITGSNRSDRIFGYSGSDRLSGGRGNDCNDGGKGNDQLSGSLGMDYLYGDSGADRLNGDRGSDRLHGGKGNDALSGDTGNDRLYGDDGNDTLNAGFGKDRVFGGRGNDAINIAVAGNRQFADCGPGRDTVRLNRTDRQRNCERVIWIR